MGGLGIEGYCYIELAITKVNILKELFQNIQYGLYFAIQVQRTVSNEIFRNELSMFKNALNGSLRSIP